MNKKKRQEKRVWTKGTDKKMETERKVMNKGQSRLQRKRLRKVQGRLQRKRHKNGQSNGQSMLQRRRLEKVQSHGQRRLQRKTWKMVEIMDREGCREREEEGKGVMDRADY